MGGRRTKEKIGLWIPLHKVLKGTFKKIYFIFNYAGICITCARNQRHQIPLEVELQVGTWNQTQSFIWTVHVAELSLQPLCLSPFWVNTIDMFSNWSYLIPTTLMINGIKKKVQVSQSLPQRNNILWIILIINMILDTSIHTKLNFQTLWRSWNKKKNWFYILLWLICPFASILPVLITQHYLSWPSS